MDRATQKLFFDFLPTNTDREYTGLGILVLLLIAFVLGFKFTPSGKKLGDYLSPIKILGGIAGRKFRNRQPVEVVISTVIIVGKDGELTYRPTCEKGFLNVTRQLKRENKNDPGKYVTIYEVFFPSHNLPNSGHNLRVDPESIQCVLESPNGNPVSQLLLFTITFGILGGNWIRRPFDPAEFPPHDPGESPPELVSGTS